VTASSCQRHTGSESAGPFRSDLDGARPLPGLGMSLQGLIADLRLPVSANAFDNIHIGKMQVNGNEIVLRGCVAGGLICTKQDWTGAQWKP